MGLIELRDVHKTVRTPDGGELHILKGIDLKIERGEHVSVVGRSGSGKSTLLNIIGLLDTASEGDVMFNDTPTRSLSAVRRDRLRGSTVGFVFQQFNLLQKRTAVENVAMPLLYERDERFWKRKRIASEMLERVGLGHRLEAKPDRLSGGEQQRVAIARALVRRPSLILADEPTGALDVETGASVMALLDEVTSETDASMIVITHDPAIAAQARRVVRIDDGRVLSDGTGEEPERPDDAERELVVVQPGRPPGEGAAVVVATSGPQGADAAEMADADGGPHAAARSVFGGGTTTVEDIDTPAPDEAVGASSLAGDSAWDAVSSEPGTWSPPAPGPSWSVVDPVGAPRSDVPAPEAPVFGPTAPEATTRGADEAEAWGPEATPTTDASPDAAEDGDSAPESTRRSRRRGGIRLWRRGRTDERAEGGR